LKSYHVAIVGATGVVGQELIKILRQRRLPLAGLHLFASDRSAGRRVSVDGEELVVEETANGIFKHVDIAFFSAGTEVSRYFAPAAVKDGALVIDSSAAWRMEDTVPLVVPEVNPDDAREHRGIIANPSCSTIQLVVALNPLHRVSPARRVIISTYQSVSGTGSPAMEELSSQVKQIMEGRNVVPHVYPHQIAFNLLPEVDAFLDNGYTKEEMKLARETGKIMHVNNLAISATCVRVPVYVGHAAAVHVEFTNRLTPEEARTLLGSAPGVRVLDDPAVSLYPQPWVAAGQDGVFVGRIREDISCANGLAMWIVADNLRKGGALNAVQIVELMIKRGWL